MISLFYPNHYADARRISSSGLEEEVRPFSLRELTGALDFRFEYEGDQEKGVGESFLQKRIRFEERLDLKARGSIYHPNLLEFNIGTSFGLRQELFRGNSDTSSNTFPYEYDVNLNFLQTKPYTFNLFANRTSETVSRQFFEPINVDSDLYGGVFRYQNDLFPATLLLQSSATREGSLDFKRNRTEKTVDLRVSNRQGEILASELNYIFKDLTEETPLRQQTSSHNLLLNSIFDYKQVHGVSSISYLKNTGTLATEQVQINENFRADHSNTFTTLFNYNFGYFASEGFASIANRGGIGFRHKLYESLVTEIRGEVSLTDATDFREFYYGPSASISYRKNVPGGLLSAGYSFLYRKTDREAEAGTIKVFGERIVLSDSQRSFLANPNVILSSVIVRDTFGAILTLNVDYRLIPSGNLTEIQRLALPDRTTVLVDYEYSSPRSLNYDTISNAVNLRYDFKQLFSLYYNYLNTRQIETSGTVIPKETSPLHDTVRDLFGAEMRWRWFFFAGEYEKDSSDLNPFGAYRVRGNFNISPTYYSLFGLSASHSRTEYEKDRNTVTLQNIDATLNLRLNSFLDASLNVGYLKENGRDVDTRAWRYKGDVKSRFRAVELKLQTEYLNRREITQTRNELLIKFNLVRHFNIL